MVRVKIVAETLSREREISELLADEEAIEIVDEGALADVVIAAGVRPLPLPAEGNVVFLGNGTGFEVSRQGRAWLPYYVAGAQLAAAVLAAAQDLTVLTREQLARLSLPHDADLDAPPAEPLTNRELQVLRMIADGLLNKQIAGRLGISGHTAKFHVAQILAKLGASSRTEAAMIAIRRGLVPL